MNIMGILFLINYILCIFAVLGMIFISKKRPTKVVSWTLLLLVPFVGLFIYIVFGAGLSRFDKRMIKKYELSSGEYNSHIKKQISRLEHTDDNNIYAGDYNDIVMLNLKYAESVLHNHNDIQFFLDGSSVFESMMNDIKNAKSSIHLEYYIFANDKTGKSLIKLLTEKAKEGVEVRILYDAIGSIRTTKHTFKKLRKAGGQTSTFFPPFLNIKFLNFKANYRNHRKIAVIDGKIAYTGGFNIRDDHMGKSKRLSPWRDTSVRIIGGAIKSFQNIFLSDWRFATKDKSSPEYYFNDKYFPKVTKDNLSTPMQVLVCGPTSVDEQIKACMIKMIYSAKKSIKIQTPYFVPDQSFVDALKMARLSGIDVEIMFPRKKDHWYMYYANLGYIDELLKYGIKAYEYDGFIHSKVLLVDDKIITLGSCNMDIRSFALNFENNVVIYDEKKALEYSKYFDEDTKHSRVYDENARKDKNILQKIAITFCRLFAEIL